MGYGLDAALGVLVVWFGWQGDVGVAGGEDAEFDFEAVRVAWVVHSPPGADGVGGEVVSFVAFGQPGQGFRCERLCTKCTDLGRDPMGLSIAVSGHRVVTQRPCGLAELMRASTSGGVVVTAASSRSFGPGS